MAAALPVDDSGCQTRQHEFVPGEDMKERTLTALIAAAAIAMTVPLAAQGKGQGKSGGDSKGQSAKQSRGQSAKIAQGQRGKGVDKPNARSGMKGDDRKAERAFDKGFDKPQKGVGKADAKRIDGVSGGDVTPRGNAFGRGKFTRDLSIDDIAPPMRVFVVSPRPGERLVGKAVALAFARGVSDDALLIVPTGERLLVRNRMGDVVLDLDQERARNPGYWKVVSLDDRVKDGAPAFCRSGAGHPVWGRQWCLDKGFGLGVDGDHRWGRTVDPRDIVFRETGTGSLTRDVLQAVLGDVVLNRLGLHAVTLGYTDPLTGRWLGDASGGRVLLLNAGGYPVAEIVDMDRDNRADNLLVALRPW
jgi:hypothetical protein